VKPQDFKFLADFLRAESGLVLSPEKTYLVESRLIPIARKRGMPGLDELVAVVRGRKDAQLNRDVVEAMTTNESFFFRDIKPFESLKGAVLPRVAAARKAAKAGKIRIWSAACSSGQEPYTIAMVLAENAALLGGLQADIVGTDLSTEILRKAKEGVYTQFEAQRGLPIQLLMKYFHQEGEHWRIADTLRNRVDYQPANLLRDMGALGRFDIVFCRNVLIYFDAPTKTEVLERIRRMMPDDGYLFLGGAETVLGVTEAFETVKGERGVYATVPGTAVAAKPAAAVAAASAAPKVAKAG